MFYLTPQDILVIHAKIVEETGGADGVRDQHLFISLSERPKTSFGGAEMYKTVFKKAAVYLESIVSYHVFIDGNKRTGIAVAARFLFINGFEFVAGNQEVEDFVLSVVNKKLKHSAIVGWLKNNSQKISAKGSKKAKKS